MSASSQSVRARRVHIWMMLLKFRHWLDLAYFLYCQSAGVVSTPLLHAITAILAFQLAPTDDALFDSVRSRLLDTHGLCAATHDEAASRSLLAAACCAGEEVRPVRSRLCAMLSTAVLSARGPATDATLCTGLVEQLLQYDGSGEDACAYLVDDIQRWVRGAIIAKLSPTGATRGGGRTTAVTSGAIPIIHAVTMVKSRRPLAAVYRLLHAQLKQLFACH